MTASKAIIEGFFARASSNKRSIIPPSYSKPVAPLQYHELEKLGKLAALDVSNKSAEFQLSVAQVLNFCSVVGDNPLNQGLPTRNHLPPKPLQEKFEEQVTEGNIADVLLNNANRTQEGYFVAPKANKME